MPKNNGNQEDGEVEIRFFDTRNPEDAAKVNRVGEFVRNVANDPGEALAIVLAVKQILVDKWGAQAELIASGKDEIDEFEKGTKRPI